MINKIVHSMAEAMANIGDGAVILVGGLMMIYVTFGGMKATTWVQIIKAVLLLLGATFMAGAVLYKFGFSPEALFAKATEVHPKGTAIMEPGSLISSTCTFMLTMMSELLIILPDRSSTCTLYFPAGWLLKESFTRPSVTGLG